jgi:cytidine deaminase
METGELPIVMQDLTNAALAAAEHSYSPYSSFRVGAALRLSNGEIVTGTNVENVSYGLTICAERSALVRAVAEFGPQIRITAMAVVNLNGAASPPCGACRQVLAEFMDPDGLVSFPAASDGAVTTATLSIAELLPCGFDLKLK